mgnify:CR=1 FL=1
MKRNFKILEISTSEEQSLVGCVVAVEPQYVENYWTAAAL